MAVTLDGNDITSKLEKNWAKTVIEDGLRQSAVGQLIPNQPMSTNGTKIPIFEGNTSFGAVNELGRKPTSDAKVRIPEIETQKFAQIIPVSTEAARANPANLMENISAKLRSDVSDQVDVAILYGRSVKSGEKIPGYTAVNDTTNRVEFPADNKELVPSIMSGYELVGANRKARPNGFVFDSLVAPRVGSAAVYGQTVNPNTGQLHTLPDLSANVAMLGGLKTVFNPSVAGAVGGSEGFGVSGFLGDWSKVYWGFGSNLDIRTYDQASITLEDGSLLSAAQHNVVFVRAEFELGWYILDPNAFAAYDAPGAAAAAA